MLFEFMLGDQIFNFNKEIGGDEEDKGIFEHVRVNVGRR